MNPLSSLLNLATNYFNPIKINDLEDTDDFLFSDMRQVKNAQIDLRTIHRYRERIAHAIATEQYEQVRILENKIKKIGLPTITL